MANPTGQHLLFRGVILCGVFVVSILYLAAALLPLPALARTLGPISITANVVGLILLEASRRRRARGHGR